MGKRRWKGVESGRVDGRINGCETGRGYGVGKAVGGWMNECRTVEGSEVAE